MLKANRHIPGQPTAHTGGSELSGSLIGEAHLPGQDVRLIEQIKSEIQALGLGKQNPDMMKSASLPIKETNLIQRSIAQARSAVVRANQNGAVEKFSIDPALAVDLGQFEVSHFVVPGFEKFAQSGINSTGRFVAQDATVVRRNSDSIVAVLADGVSSAPLSHYGAALLSTAAADIVGRHVSCRDGTLLDAKFLGQVYADLYKETCKLSAELGLHPVRACDLCLATTLQIVVVTPQETIAFGLGDGHLKTGSDWQNLLGFANRTEAMNRYNIPPLLSTAIAGDRDLIEQRSSALKLAAYHANTPDGVPERTLVNDAELMRNYFDEALAFDIYRYQSSAETMQSGLSMTSDGISYTDLPPRTKHRATSFPHDALTDPKLRGAQEELLRVWNIAADHPDRGPSENNSNRIRRVHSMIRSGNVPLSNLIDPLIERAILNSDSPYSSALDQLDPAEIAEFCVHELAQGAFNDEHIVQFSRSLRHEARTLLNARLPGLGITSQTELTPLSDDFSLITIEPLR